MLPGRFPSPTPPPPSTYATEVHIDTSNLAVANNPTPDPFGPGRFNSTNYTAPFHVRKRPKFAETQSEASLPLPLSSKSISSTAASTPSSPRVAGRPREKRSISDNRYDRTRGALQNTGSPIGKRKERMRRGSRLPEHAFVQNEETESRAKSPNISMTKQHDNGELAPGSDPEDQVTDFQFSFCDPKNPHHVHDELLRRLKKDVTLEDRQDSSVYLFRNRDQPNLLKIGMSKNPTERSKAIQDRCGVNIEYIGSISGLSCAKKIEQLAQGDLWHLCRPYLCAKCKRRHREWHEVSEDLARKTIARWSLFIKNQRPYNSKGQLKGIWLHLLSKRGPSLPRNTALNHESRWDLWSKILEPITLKDWCVYLFSQLTEHPLWLYLWEFSWQVSTVVSWMITYFRFQHHCVFSILCCFIFCACVSIAAHPYEQYKRSPKNRVKGNPSWAHAISLT